MLLLQAQQVARHFGADILFENVNLDIKDNSKIALVGRNGAGKSTLIKMLIGESLPDEGKIVTKRDLTIGYLAQHTGLESTKNVLDEMLSVFEPLQKKLRFINLKKRLLLRQFHMNLRNINNY